MRAISILMVMLNHFTISLPDSLEFFRERGHLGVEVFFAVSGFLVMRSLHMCSFHNRGNLWKTLRDFYIRRGSRIFVPYYFTLTLILGLTWVIGSLRDKVSSIQDIIWSFPFYFYNYAKTLTSGKVPGSLNIMWSLSFEEQFYLLLGVCFLLFNKRLTSSLVVIGCLSLLARFTTVFVEGDVSFFHLQMWTHIRLDAILWGCLAYLFFEPLKTCITKRTWLQTVILAGSVGAFLMGKIHGSGLLDALAFTLTAIFFTLLAAQLVALPASRLARLLSLPPLVFVGKISYEIYLTHQLVNAILIKSHIDSRPLIYGLAMVAGSVLVSTIFYFVISHPTQKYLRSSLSLN